MSWTVNGREYHDYDEYQRALRDTEQNRAQQRVADLERRLNQERQEYNNLQGRLNQINQNLQGQLDGAQRSITEQRQHIAEQQRIQVQMDQRMQGMQRLQGEMQREQVNIRNDLERGFRQVQEQFGVLQADIEHEMQTMQAEIDREFSRLEQDMQAGFQQAARERQEMDQRLTQNIQKVQKNFENYAQAQMQRESTQMSQTEVNARLADEILMQYSESRLSRAGLWTESQQIRQLRMQIAASSHAPQTALAHSGTMLAQAQTLEMSLFRREAELDTVKEMLINRLSVIENRIQNDKRIQYYFSQEVTLALDKITRLKQMIENSYEKYAALDTQLQHDENNLMVLENTINDMVVMAPIIEGMDNQRNTLAKNIIRASTDAGYGFLSNKVQPQYADPNDKKSNITLDLDFNGPRIRMNLPLDPFVGFSLDSYGFGSNTECTSAAAPLLKQLQETMHVNEPMLDSENRKSPQVNPVLSSQHLSQIQGYKQNLQNLNIRAH